MLVEFWSVEVLGRVEGFSSRIQAREIVERKLNLLYNVKFDFSCSLPKHNVPQCVHYASLTLFNHLWNMPEFAQSHYSIPT